jgi:putative colanic acid biosynthesis acetyltransferase WcaB
MVRFLEFVFQDWRVNAQNPKIQIILALFRLAQRLRAWPRALAPLVIPYLIFYRVLVEWVLCVELPWHVRVGPCLRIFHGAALVVHPKAVLGAHCTLRHATTIGAKEPTATSPGGVPVIGDRVDVGPNSVILGPITIGDGAVVGAGSVVVRDVAPGDVVAGNPARSLRKRAG